MGLTEDNAAPERFQIHEDDSDVDSIRESGLEIVNGVILVEPWSRIQQREEVALLKTSGTMKTKGPVKTGWPRGASLSLLDAAVAAGSAALALCSAKAAAPRAVCVAER